MFNDICFGLIYKLYLLLMFGLRITVSHTQIESTGELRYAQRFTLNVAAINAADKSRDQYWFSARWCI